VSDDVPKKSYERGEAVLQIFQRGADFTRQLLAENQQLRTQIRSMDDRQTQAAQDDGEWGKLREELLERIHNLQAENQNILERLRAVEAENQQFAGRYLEIEEENNNLANLYVASYQLHSTLDPSEVLKVILEIVINLIGAEVFCVYVMDDRTNILEPVASEGEPIQSFPKVPLAEGFVGGSVATGEVETRDPHSDVVGSLVEAGAVVCIPLRVQDKPVGAIAIYSLLQQKDGFSPLDQELFTLLAGHAATAIFASRLHSQSERKLNTIQGFIDLLTK
jgi:nitrate/nitrite-specific signal transduction histidine kinase